MCRTSAGLVIFLALATLGCQTSAPRAPAIGHAFVGPLNLSIRKEILPSSPVVAVLHYPQSVDIVQKRRHFVKVRTEKNAEGWTDERLLLDNAAMEAIKKLSADAKNYPSHGKATTNDLLNVHTEPQRQSPSYLQIQSGERVDVIGHQLVDRNAPARKSNVLNPLPPPKPRPSKKKKGKYVAVITPPLAPKLPDNWIELSKEREVPPDPEPPEQEKEEPAAPQVAPDDWTLIRTASGQSGWVLTRRIYMAIPDEVAQYAEGRRITSYFSLGKVQDEDQQKDIWLWTTITAGPHPYDFDNYRVFVWNVKRHRYETAYIQRRIAGYFPVETRPGAFSVLLEDEDGKRRRHHFSLLGNRVMPGDVTP